MGIAAAFITTYYKKALEKVGTRPTKPGDLLLPTRVPEWSHVRGMQSFASRRLQYLCTAAAVYAQQSVKKDLKLE